MNGVSFENFIKSSHSLTVNALPISLNKFHPISDVLNASSNSSSDVCYCFVVLLDVMKQIAMKCIDE